MDIRQVMTDPNLFGRQFGGESWAAWRALLAGFYGLELDRAERSIFRRLTGAHHIPKEPQDELWQVVGRRGGKSQCAALLAVYESAFKDYSAQLSPGEVATVMALSADRKQSRSVMRYVSGLLHSNPMLKAMIVREDREAIELSNRTVIETHTASFRATRGYTVAAALCDEVAFWRSEDSANPDYEIINAIRPAMASLNGKLIALSSPYAKRGELWHNYRRYYGRPADGVVVAKAPSRTMNPELPQKVVDKAYKRDPDSAKAEYGAQFRDDIASFVDREVLEGLVRSGPVALPYDRRQRYFAFVDPAGGGQDEFCLAIGHAEGQKTIADALYARTGEPQGIVADYAATLKSYGIRRVTGDRYAGSWPADEFKRHGITFEYSSKVRSDLYKDALSVINSGQCELPPDDRMVTQFIGLERRTGRSGKDIIDHAPGSHDDRANVAAGLLSQHSKSTNLDIWRLMAR